MEIVQDSLAERIDKLIKKSSVVDSRLDIIEEELEEQTKISINGMFYFVSVYFLVKFLFLVNHARDVFFCRFVMPKVSIRASAPLVTLIQLTVTILRYRCFP